MKVGPGVGIKSLYPTYVRITQSQILNMKAEKEHTTSLRYKTELCRAYKENGVCRFGTNCTFAHGIQELRAVPRHPRYKTEPCRNYQSLGFCQYGTRCHFIHNPEEANSSLLRGRGLSNRFQEKQEISPSLLSVAAKIGILNQMTGYPTGNSILLTNLRRLYVLSARESLESTRM